MCVSVIALDSVAMMVAARLGAARRVVGLILVAAMPYLGDPGPYSAAFRVPEGGAILL